MAVIGLGILPSPMLRPSNRYVVGLVGSTQSGVSTSAPASGSLTEGLRNTAASAATAQAKVTIARLTPRTRSAGTATIIPATRATTAPATTGHGNGHPCSLDSFETANAE